jgi:hypothetical protein
MNDTSIISYLQGGVFDTTLCIIYGTLIDKQTLSPLKGFVIQISRGTEKLFTKTNNKGEFKFSRDDLSEGKWELFISPKKYSCLYIKDINQFRSKAGFIRCKIKLYRPT